MHLIKMQWQNQQQVQLQLEERLRRNPVCFSIEKVGDEKKPEDRPTRRQNTKNEECRI